MANQYSFQNLESAVQNANSKISTVASKLIQVEKNLVDGGLETDADNVVVMELLESMTEVKIEYQNLRKDIQEVQQLQREMNNSLRNQMRAMTQTFAILKKKIEKTQAPAQ